MIPSTRSLLLRRIDARRIEEDVVMLRGGLHAPTGWKIWGENILEVSINLETPTQQREVIMRNTVKMSTKGAWVKSVGGSDGKNSVERGER